MTATEMDTLLKNMLGDPNGYRWDHDKRMLALNTAADDIVNMVLGLAQENRKCFDHLYDLMHTVQISVTDGDDGYALSGLAVTDNGEMFSEAGFVRAECTLDGSKRRCLRLPAYKEGYQSNQYLSGNNEWPILTLENGYINIDVDSGSYPVTVDLVYIRKPRNLVTDGLSSDNYDISTSELPISLHRAQVKLAEAYCRRMADDFEQYNAIYSEVMNQIQMIVTGSMTAVRADTMQGQHGRKQ